MRIENYPHFFSVRLSERNGDMGKGVLEVYKPNEQEWSPACVKNWDRSVSPTAVCAMLGYSSVNATGVVTRNTKRPLLASVNVSTDIWRMYSKKRSNLMREFSSCKTKEDYPIAELTCTNYCKFAYFIVGCKYITKHFVNFSLRTC